MTEVKEGNKAKTTKMSYKDFVLKFIELRKGEYKGVNTVASKLNQALEQYYGKDNIEKISETVTFNNKEPKTYTGAKAIVQRLVREGVITSNPGSPRMPGIMIYPAGTTFDDKGVDAIIAELEAM